MQPSAALKELESEAIFVLRETAGRFDNPYLLFSGGKDSIVLAHLAKRAFHPAPAPFKLLHIDTGHDFPETLEFRDQFAHSLGLALIVREVQASIDAGRVQEEPGPFPSRNSLQSVTLMDAIQELKADAAIGGARRDEERARAKERFFSHRDATGQWQPRSQRPEVWRHYNTRRQHGDHFRVFPLNNWTELDVWQYIQFRDIEVPSLYFAHEREVIQHGSVWLAVTPYIEVKSQSDRQIRTVRFRTIGDATCTGAVLSEATTVEHVTQEVESATLSERSTRADDKRSDAAMEDRKKQGYF